MDALTLKLSKREREILQWTGEGKTSAEIAIILSVIRKQIIPSEEIPKKFNAPNKTQIACYAAAMNVLKGELIRWLFNETAGDIFLIQPPFNTDGKPV